MKMPRIQPLNISTKKMCGGGRLIPPQNSSLGVGTEMLPPAFPSLPCQGVGEPDSFLELETGTGPQIFWGNMPGKLAG